MRSTVLIALVALAGCADTGPMQVGPDRYRITKDSFWTSGSAEAAVIQEAGAFCAARGMQVDLQMTNSRPAVAYQHYAGASADFRCVPQSRPAAP